MTSHRFFSGLSAPLQHLLRLGFLAVALAASAVLAVPAAAQSFAPSMCQAVAQSLPGARFAALMPQVPARPLPVLPSATDTGRSVTITFVGHATFRIETPGGVIIVTDYSGPAGSGPVPTVATMNHAHSSHWTNTPDPRIEHVLPGWNPDGGPADHHLLVGDVLIRNVSTDIRSWERGLELDGNSIFIFEVADLCIGHLGHLHQVLEDDHIALIGRLDVVMVAVDGTYTMSQESVVQVVQRLRARIVLPMHYFSAWRLNEFLDDVRPDLAIDIRSDPTMTVSLATLPREPTVVVLPGY
ncbi:MBL fold metallo-hydrolase [Amorphus coralli]|uniref:MBL fold metallo-hydrolase n=1 Tax=Amorphus coralli TaxID=340680 RepID=UPI000373F32D|nr:MBL fold metallo-hydrolase [Amorphus coralli]